MEFVSFQFFLDTAEDVANYYPWPLLRPPLPESASDAMPAGKYRVMLGGELFRVMEGRPKKRSLPPPLKGER